MSFNKYSVYSVISSVGGKNEQNIQKILELTEKFNHFKDYKHVKNYLENELNMLNGHCNFNDCIITTKEDKNVFLVKMNFCNENYQFYYNK